MSVISARVGVLWVQITGDALSHRIADYVSLRERQVRKDAPRGVARRDPSAPGHPAACPAPLAGGWKTGLRAPERTGRGQWM